MQPAYIWFTALMHKIHIRTQSLMQSSPHEYFDSGSRQTFPEGEAPLHPGSHTAHQGHLAAAAQRNSLPGRHPLVINVGPVAAVVLQHCLQGCAAGANGRLQANGAVQPTDSGVGHLHKAHLGEVVAAPKHHTAQL